MAIHWDDSLVLGIEEIDLQHRSLIEQFQKLSDAAQQGKEKEVIADLTDFLFEYSQFHFATEEKLMAEHRYPKIETQRREHDDFTRDALEFKGRIMDEGPTRAIALEITGKLVKWIIQHIRNHDRHMVEYVKESIALRQKYTD